MALVSVIIPTRNRAHLLPVALGSVLKQSFQDFEIFVVDDASTDATAELRDFFHDSRIHWLRHPASRGGAAARNTGILHSRAPFIAFLDDDDEWYPQKLARQMEIISKSTADVAAIYTGYLVANAATGKLIGQKTPSKRGELYPHLLKSNCVGTTSCVLLRRACLAKVGMFDEGFPSFQDYDLWLRISRHFRFDHTPEPLLKYFVHPKKISTDPEALRRGLEIMLAKYGRSADFRRYCSNLYLGIGATFCESRRIEEGRQAFSTAIALNPYRLRPYLYRSLAVFGSETFLAARAALANARKRLRRCDFAIRKSDA